MIFVSDEEIEARLEHPNNVVHKIMHDGKGRPSGVKNIDEATKVEIGVTAKALGPTAAAEIFDCSISQASNFSKGKTVHGDGNPELKLRVENETTDIHAKARDLVLQTLNVIEIETVREESPRVQAAIAKDLATIIEKTSPKDGGGANVLVQIYSPRQDKIDVYETVVIEAEVKN